MFVGPVSTAEEGDHGMSARRSFFRALGEACGPWFRKSKWVLAELAGTDQEIARAERGVGSDMLQAFAAQREPDQKPASDPRLERIGARLAERASAPLCRFQFLAFAGSELNALALPGGFILVAAPLMKLCAESDDELAFAMAHEMAHVVLRHARDRLLSRGVMAVLNSTAASAGGAVMERAAKIFINSAYSREQESEADQYAVRLCRRAGFDPSGVVHFFERLLELDPSTDSLAGYFSSHPPTADRLAHARRLASNSS
jgi:beta-barrel assembly-enhancing protease